MFAQSNLFFFLLYCFSFVLTISCSDWFLMWVGLEVNMMSFISLIYSRSAGSVEVSMKYFFIQSIGSGLLMMMFYSEFYWMDYLSLSVLSYKIGGGPFFFWFPSVCESISWGGCFLLMTVQKVLPMMIISFLVSMFLWWIIIISIVVGVLGAMNQKSLKRMMSYSSIHHIGWILLGNFINESVWMIYLLIYSIMLSGVIYNLWKDKILEVGNLGELTSKMMFVMGMLSMGGMPPMLGFYLKWWLMINLMTIDLSMMILMIVMSVLMFYIYFRVIYMTLLSSSNKNSWKVMSMKNEIMGIDLLYILGLNLGMMAWLLF